MDPKLKAEKLMRARSVLAGLGVREVRVSEGTKVVVPADQDALDAIEMRAAKAEGRLKVLEHQVEVLLAGAIADRDRVACLERLVGTLTERPAGAPEAPPVPRPPPRARKATEGAGSDAAPWKALGISRRTYFNRKKAGKL